MDSLITPSLVGHLKNKLAGLYGIEDIGANSRQPVLEQAPESMAKIETDLVDYGDQVAKPQAPKTPNVVSKDGVPIKKQEEYFKESPSSPLDNPFETAGMSLAAQGEALVNGGSATSILNRMKEARLKEFEASQGYNPNSARSELLRRMAKATMGEDASKVFDGTSYNDGKEYFDDMLKNSQVKDSLALKEKMMSARGFGSSRTKTPPEFIIKNGMLLSGAIDYADLVLQDLKNYQSRGILSSIVGRAKDASGVLSKTYEGGKGISSPEQLEDAFQRAGKQFFATIQNLTTGAAFSEQEAKNIQRQVEAFQDPKKPFEERVAAFREARRLTNERLATLTNIYETGKLPAPKGELPEDLPGNTGKIKVRVRKSDAVALGKA